MKHTAIAAMMHSGSNTAANFTLCWHIALNIHLGAGVDAIRHMIMSHKFEQSVVTVPRSYAALPYPNALFTQLNNEAVSV